MKRRAGIGTASLVLAALGVLVGACDDGNYYYYPRGHITCGQLTTCEVCTPVVGCGWCQLAGGGGVCTDGPGDCPPTPLASWTWEPTGCRRDGGNLADASVGTRDDGGGPSSDASSRDDAPAPSKDASGD
jgi:hypothetical protein